MFAMWIVFQKILEKIILKKLRAQKEGCTSVSLIKIWHDDFSEISVN